MNNKLITKARIYAAMKHAGQKRKNGDDFINHPFRVADYVNYYFNDLENKDDLLIASYLHDIIEDTEATYDDLISNFNITIANLVNELTNNKEIKNKIGKTKYLQMKMLLMTDDALNIKLCDRLDNVTDLENAPALFSKKYIMETLDVFTFLIYNRELTDTQRIIISDTIFKIRELNKNGLKNPSLNVSNSL